MILAHGIGGRADLPVPLSFFVIGAGVALVVSFLALAALWPEPRLQDGGTARPLKASWLRPASATLRVVGLMALLLGVTAGFVDGSEGRNIAPVLVFVFLWLVVPFLVAIVGNFWTWMSPWRTLADRLNRDVPERPRARATLGLWPATVAFVAFTWLELAAPDRGPRMLAFAAVIYTLYLLAATAAVGVGPGLHSFGVFENYNRVLGAISPVAIEPPSRSVGAAPAATSAAVAWRGWLRGLPSLAEEKGLIALVVVMIGTVSYDGMSATEWWVEQSGSLRTETWFATVALLATVAVIGAGYYLASWTAARLAGEGTTPADVARRFAHTLVPIALAYAVAHYFTLVLFEGQLLLHTASDPFGLGWDLLGTAGWRISFFLTPNQVWYVQVGAIVLGHIAGVVLAHDRALADFGGRVAVRTQYAMLLLMVALTSLGLFILAG